MQVEYEATFPNIEKDDIRRRLKQAGAILVRLEFLQKRVVFDLPEGHEIPGGWLRVRDEGNKITMSLKIVDGSKIENQHEICLIVNSFADAVELLELTGCQKKSFQESKRELWKLNTVEITIDEWPFLEPFVEIEGHSEKDVREASKLLGFDYTKALFCSVDALYSRKYHIADPDVINHAPRLTFSMKNPFL